MARDGLIKNGDWVMPAAVEAAGLFSDAQLILPAQFLAVLDRFALDYIRQAPVIVVAATHRRNLARRTDRMEVGTRFIEECRAGRKLAELLKGYALAPQLRALSGQSLRVGQKDLLVALSAVVPPSALAQAIPKPADEQQAWLRGVEAWRFHMLRHFRNSNLLLAWAAVNVRTEAARACATDIADFAGRNRNTFNPDWSFEQALVATRRWHDELAIRAPVAEAARPDWRTPIDYAPLPLAMEVDGYSFDALQTREALHEEGARMHHCVRLYSEKVARGTSRIYSVRRNGVRIATLELVRTSRAGATTQRFAAAQLKGPHNSSPAVEVAEAAARFLRAVNPPVTAIAGILSPDDPRSHRAANELRRRLGSEVYSSWFISMRFEAFDGKTLSVSFATKFLRKWVETHFLDVMHEKCALGFDGLEHIELAVRSSGSPGIHLAMHDVIHPQ